MVEVHIAVLDTDVPCYRVYAKRGLYNTQFRRLLQAAAERINKSGQELKHGEIQVRVTGFDVVGGVFPSLECLRVDTAADGIVYTDTQPPPIDALLVTGAAAAAYDDLHWIPPLQSYLQKVYSEFPLVRIFGSCFGHQLIGQALLGAEPDAKGDQLSGKAVVKLMPDGHEIGPHLITLNPKFARRFAPLQRFSSTNPLRLQLIHGDAVVPYQELNGEKGTTDDFLEGSWMSIGTTDRCSIQGLYNPGRVLTLQGHFEYDAFATGELCHQFANTFKWSESRLSAHLEKIWESSRHGMEDDDDSGAVAEAVLLFFAGEN